jgi:hypothetical protein
MVNFPIKNYFRAKLNVAGGEYLGYFVSYFLSFNTNMVNTMAEDSSTSSVKPSTSIGDTSRPAAKAAESQHSQTNTPATTNSNSHNSTTASAAEVANPDHPHHRHNRTINDFELMGTLGEGSYSTVLIICSIYAKTLNFVLIPRYFSILGLSSQRQEDRTFICYQSTGQIPHH